MIEKIVKGFAELVSTIVGTLGLTGTLWLIFGLLLFWLALLCGRALVRFLLACQKLWRKLPRAGKQTVAIAGLFCAYFVLWPLIPKTQAVLGVTLGFAMFWWVRGWDLARRYGIDGGFYLWKPHVYHAEITAMQRGMTSAVENATGKKNGKARVPTITPTGLITKLEPPDQMSPQELADAINDGTLEPSLGRQIGWERVNGTFAEVDGNLVAVYVAATRANEHDPLATVHRWPGMEMVDGKPLPWDQPIPFGVTRTGTANFPPLLHALMGGATNAGKSVVANNIILGLAQREHTQFVLVDPKIVEFPVWQWGARAACIASGPKAALPAFKLVHAEMMDRYEDSERQHIKTHIPTVTKPRLVVVVDEMAEILLGPEGSQIEEVMQSILAMGRAAGILLINATQQPDAQMLKTRLRNNHRQRICLGTESQDQTKMILGPDAGQIGCHRIPESMPGRGWIRVDRQFTEFRSYFITDDEVEQVVQATAHLRQDLPGFPAVIKPDLKIPVGGKKS